MVAVLSTWKVKLPKGRRLDSWSRENLTVNRTWRIPEVQLSIAPALPSGEKTGSLMRVYSEISVHGVAVPSIFAERYWITIPHCARQPRYIPGCPTRAWSSNPLDT